MTANAQSPLRNIVQDVALEQHLDAQLPLDVTVRDEHGHKKALREVFSKRPVILNFIQIRCPMLCTQVLNGLLRTSQAIPFVLGQDYDIVTISIDPRETSQMAAAKKKSYVAKYRRPGAEEGWHFFTAHEETIAKLTKTAGFRFRYDEATDQYAHASGIILLTPEGRISRYFYGIDYEPNDLRLGLVEASENKIGSLVEQVLLLCFHYDPATGRYGFAISNTLKVAGLLTVVALGTYLFRMFRLERQRPKLVRPLEAVP